MARARSPRVSPCHPHGAAHRRRGGQFCRKCSRDRCASSAAKAKHLGWQSVRLVSGSSRPYFRAALVLNISLNSRTRNRRLTSAEFACHRHHRAGVGQPGALRQPVVPDQREQFTDVAGRCADLRYPGPHCDQFVGAHGAVGIGDRQAGGKQQITLCRIAKR